VLGGYGVCAYRQATHWTNSFNLYSHAIEAKHGSYLAYHNRGIAYGDRGDWQRAIQDLSQAIEMDSGHPQAFNTRGTAYAILGRLNDAIADFSEAIAVRPDYSEALNNRGSAYSKLGRWREAMEDFVVAMRIKPDWPSPMNNLAWLIATDSRIANPDRDGAIRLARRACEITDYQNPDCLDTLAAAYASAGRFSEAVDTANMALRLAETGNRSELRKMIEYHLSLYRQGKPYIEPVQEANKP
jgi:tetratricopeptide (TPR) repeat protein